MWESFVSFSKFSLFDRMSRLKQEKNWTLSWTLYESFIQIFRNILLSFRLCDVPNTITTTPTICITVKHKSAIFFLLIFYTIKHFHSLYQAFSRVKSILFVLLGAPWRPATSLISHHWTGLSVFSYWFLFNKTIKQ